MASDDFQERLRRIQSQREPGYSEMIAAPEGAEAPDPDQTAPANATVTLIVALLALPLGIGLGVVTGLYLQAAMQVGQSLLISLMLGLLHLLLLVGLMVGYVLHEQVRLAFPACLIALIGSALAIAGVLVL